MSEIRWFQELSRNDVALAGGKGANLGEMTRAGLPIPPGFVVTAETYRTFLQKSGLPERIASELDGLDVEDTDHLNAAAAAIQELILAMPIPDDFRHDLLAAYHQLPERFVAPPRTPRPPPSPG